MHWVIGGRIVRPALQDTVSTVTETRHKDTSTFPQIELGLVLLLTGQADVNRRLSVTRTLVTAT
ncbi:MAG: hypothetical protein SNJ58_14730 [Aggregatilineales bacterium]